MRISVIVPVFNEAANLQKGVMDRIGNYTKDDDRFVEILIADDGSSDNTTAIIERDYLPKFKKFKLLKLAHGGKANTIISATKQAAGDFILMTDADLATPIDECTKLITVQEQTKAPIVIGSRGISRPDAPMTRTILAIGMVVLRYILFGLGNIKDTQCGFKLFDKNVASDLMSKLLVFKRKKVGSSASVSAIFDLEFLYLARKMEHAIEEVPVEWRHVETKRVSFFKDMIESLKDMARLKYYGITGRYVR